MNRLNRLRALVVSLVLAMLWQALVPCAAWARTGGAPTHDICFGQGARPQDARALLASMQGDPDRPADHAQSHCALCTLASAGPQPDLAAAPTRAQSERELLLPLADGVRTDAARAWVRPETRAPPSA